MSVTKTMGTRMAVPEKNGQATPIEAKAKPAHAGPRMRPRLFADCAIPHGAAAHAVGCGAADKALQ